MTAKKIIDDNQTILVKPVTDITKNLITATKLGNKLELPRTERILASCTARLAKLNIVVETNKVAKQAARETAKADRATKAEARKLARATKLIDQLKSLGVDVKLATDES